ncbi:hypothetical protein BV22DRAFT_1200340 [Leucogyrophana mollusca]|uniref:Uncharacterized protein n=1 Tax=Leucogyrophana mollusca TaxID=85980 RepID=A0ACB8AUJ1_9AGAM|nr:hypothetical protein BV22DRAFT_1200340 [Leucogyrophana mollusca]
MTSSHSRGSKSPKSSRKVRSPSTSSSSSTISARTRLRSSSNTPASLPYGSSPPRSISPPSVPDRPVSPSVTVSPAVVERLIMGQAAAEVQSMLKGTKLSHHPCVQPLMDAIKAPEASTLEWAEEGAKLASLVAEAIAARELATRKMVELMSKKADSLAKTNVTAMQNLRYMESLYRSILESETVASTQLNPVEA